jgi:hypothetical protein
MEYKKKFLIIGTDNCRTYKEIFPFIKNNQFYCGLHHVKQFTKPDGSIKNFGNVSWYTNLENSKRNEVLNTGKKYYGYENMYPKYDNYDAISVDKVNDIPMDYDGVMGVPITFLDKYNPDQFEILGATESEGKGFSCGLWHESSRVAQALVHNEKKFKRLFIRKKKDH